MTNPETLTEHAILMSGPAAFRREGVPPDRDRGRGLAGGGTVTDLPEPWQLYPMPAEQVRKIQAHVAAQVEHQSAGRAADVAGALASLVRATDPTDPRYDALREAYGVALETAGLVPGDGRWTCRKCGGRLSSCVACGDPAHCGDVYCDTHDETTANAT